MNVKFKHRKRTVLFGLALSVTVLVTALSGIAMAVDQGPSRGRPPAADVAALNKLEADFHMAGSNQDTVLLRSLFAEDATLVTGNKTYVGPAAIVTGFMTTGPYQPGNHWAGLTPSYRIRIDVVNGHKATMYFECDYVDKTTLQVKAQIGANTTEVRRHGKWLFETFSGGPPPKL